MLLLYYCLTAAGIDHRLVLLAQCCYATFMLDQMSSPYTLLPFLNPGCVDTTTVMTHMCLHVASICGLCMCGMWITERQCAICACVVCGIQKRQGTRRTCLLLGRPESFSASSSNPCSSFSAWSSSSSDSASHCMKISAVLLLLDVADDHYLY